ncbi:NADP-dependent phosphogluconate dehydrogenase, partial [Buchnera aphidicola]|nr:NADP-dependent phosphogluconate dehydrogenase [Buchnera aphidicola]
VSVFNRTSQKTKEFISQHSKKNIFPYFCIKDFINSLERPRCILLMVKAGKSTDETIKSILPYLDKDDILMDGGNTFYKDTIRR